MLNILCQNVDFRFEIFFYRKKTKYKRIIKKCFNFYIKLINQHISSKTKLSINPKNRIEKRLVLNCVAQSSNSSTDPDTVNC